MAEPTHDDDLQERIARALYEDTGCAIPWSLITTDPDFEPRALTWRGHAAAALEALGEAGLVIVRKDDLRRYCDRDDTDLKAAVEGLQRLWTAAGIED